MKGKRSAKASELLPYDLANYQVDRYKCSMGEEELLAKMFVVHLLHWRWGVCAHMVNEGVGGTYKRVHNVVMGYQGVIFIC